MEARFQIAADLHQLKAVRQFVEENAARLRIDPEIVYKLMLAIDELLTNIITHGYRGQLGTIEIELHPLGSDLEIKLIDHQSPPFDPTTVPAPDLHSSFTERPIGGLGIFLVRKIVDDMTYRSSLEHGNEITLLKKAIIHSA